MGEADPIWERIIRLETWGATCQVTNYVHKWNNCRWLWGSEAPSLHSSQPQVSEMQWSSAMVALYDSTLSWNVQTKFYLPKLRWHSYNLERRLTVRWYQPYRKDLVQLNATNGVLLSIFQWRICVIFFFGIVLHKLIANVLLLVGEIILCETWTENKTAANTAFKSITSWSSKVIGL